MGKIRAGLIGLTLTSALALTGYCANAADIYVPGPGGYKDGPVYIPSWAGFYVGVNGGYGWSSEHKVLDFQIAGVTTDFIKGPDASGGFGGGQIGYNWQRDHIVFGVEADIQGSGINDRFNAVSNNGISGTVRSDIDYFGTVRGRLGYAFDRTLLYFTGGFAYGNVKTSEVDVTINFKNSNTMQTGFVLGGGIEHKFTPSWSVKAEYQFIDLGDYRLHGTDTFGSTFTSNDLNASIHTVRVGLNYHIHNEYVPLK